MAPPQREMWDTGYMLFVQQTNRKQELELFSLMPVLGFCTWSQAQGSVLPESSCVCVIVTVCGCSHNFAAMIHCQKFGSGLCLLVQIVFPSPRSLQRLSEVTRVSYLKI